jgi:hypothetical protein
VKINFFFYISIHKNIDDFICVKTQQDFLITFFWLKKKVLIWLWNQILQYVNSRFWCDNSINFLSPPTISVLLFKPYILSFLFFNCIWIVQVNKIMHQSILFILSLVVIIQLTYACYITNCPIGGKRSLFSNEDLHTHEVRNWFDIYFFK